MLDLTSGGTFAGRPHRILVIDDDPDILRLVSDKLDRAGFEVVTAASGPDALDLSERRGLLIGIVMALCLARGPALRYWRSTSMPVGAEQRSMRN